MKYDNGKLQSNILFEDFPLALREVAAVATYGAVKYERSSWKGVPNCEVRYGDAKARHVIEQGIGEFDEESELYHLAHEAWNCFALLQLKLEEQTNEQILTRYQKSFGKAAEAKKKQMELFNGS